MTALVVLLALAAGAGWTLAAALGVVLVGRALRPTGPRTPARGSLAAAVRESGAAQARREAARLRAAGHDVTAVGDQLHPAPPRPPADFED